MIKTKLPLKITSVLMVTGLLVSLSASSVMAADTSSVNQTKVKPGVQIGFHKGPGFVFSTENNLIKELVSKGIITQEQVDKWQAFVQSKAEALKAEGQTNSGTVQYKKIDLISELVSAGIITQEQADKITALKPTKEGGNSVFILKGSGDLQKKLIDQGIITQEQADKWQAYEKSQAETMKAEMDKVKTMTDTERKAYLNDLMKKKPDMMAGLVAAGIINQEQADNIAALMPQMKAENRGPVFKVQAFMGSDLQKKLIDQGIITQEQADKWQTFMQSKVEGLKAEMDKVKDMTATERETYLSGLKQQKTDLMAELVSAGIITQEQADKIAALMPQKVTQKVIDEQGGAGHKFMIRHNIQMDTIDETGSTATTTTTD